MFTRYITLFLCCFSFLAYTQKPVQLSAFSEISVVTSGPGEALYEKFGHTAIRVKDPMLQLDLVYNYGIYDFDQPNFYLNFTKGFMKYKLARYPFHYAVKSAQEDKRWMKQQVLNLSSEEKNALFSFLEVNASPKNAGYLYDPFFNNCATKPRDIIHKILGKKVVWSTDFTSNASLRELMNTEIHKNTWGSLGINLALGSKLDKKATAFEYLYLPDYVFKALATSKILNNGKEENLVRKTQTILNFKEKELKSSVVSPFLVFSIVLIIGLFISYNDLKNNKRSKWFDFFLFLTIGIVGGLVLFLWFFTNHSTAPNNFNILWAFPLNLIVSFYVLKKKTPNWIKKYTLFLLGLLVLIPVVWFSKIQLFNYTLIPLFLLLGIRYFLIGYKKL